MATDLERQVRQLLADVRGLKLALKETQELVGKLRTAAIAMAESRGESVMQNYLSESANRSWIVNPPQPAVEAPALVEQRRSGYLRVWWEEADEDAESVVMQEDCPIVRREGWLIGVTKGWFRTTGHVCDDAGQFHALWLSRLSVVESKGNA